jgi:hypothetical protein
MAWWRVLRSRRFHRRAGRFVFDTGGCAGDLPLRNCPLGHDFGFGPGGDVKSWTLNTGIEANWLVDAAPPLPTKSPGKAADM